MIRKGEPWGEPVEPTGSEPVAASDAELAALLAKESPPELVALSGGDLHHSLGGQAASQPMALPVDVIEVIVGDATYTAVAHVVARGAGWAGPFAVAMNGTHLGDWNLGPKAHPNDGLIDVTAGALGLRDRLAARRRAPAGTHLPHPALRTERVAAATWTFERPRSVYVDGRPVGAATLVVLRVVPDRGAVVLT